MMTNTEVPDYEALWRAASEAALGSSCALPKCEDCQAAATVLREAIAPLLAELQAERDKLLRDYSAAERVFRIAGAERDATIARLTEALRIIQANAMNIRMGAVDYRYITERRARAALNGGSSERRPATTQDAAADQVRFGK